MPGVNRETYEQLVDRLVAPYWIDLGLPQEFNKYVVVTNGLAVFYVLLMNIFLNTCNCCQFREHVFVIMAGADHMIDRGKRVWESSLEAYCIALAPRHTAMDTRRWAPLCGLGEYHGGPGECAIEWCKGPSGHLWFFCAHTSCKYCLLLVQVHGYTLFVVRIIRYSRWLHRLQKFLKLGKFSVCIFSFFSLLPFEGQDRAG